MAWCAHRRRRSFIVPLYCSQFRVSRRYVPFLESGGAPCPSRSFRRRVGWPGRTGPTVTTRSRRRGLTCLRSGRCAPAAPTRQAIRPVRGALVAPEGQEGQEAPAGVPRSRQARPPGPVVTAALRALRAATAAQARRDRRLPRQARAGSPGRLRTTSKRSGPSGSNPRPRTRPRRLPRRSGRASPAGARCAPRRAGGGGGTTWAAAWSSWSGRCSRWCC